MILEALLIWATFCALCISIVLVYIKAIQGEPDYNERQAQQDVDQLVSTAMDDFYTRRKVRAGPIGE